MLGLFAIGNRTFLFSDTLTVRTRFTRVAGLQSGAPVQYQGVNVGRVGSVRLPAAPGERIEVSMAISHDAAHLVRENTQAQIKSDGLVGEQIIVLVSTAEPSPAVEPDGYIVGIDPFDLFEITDRALQAVLGFQEAAAAFEQIMTDVQAGEGTLGKIVYDPSLYEELVSTANETRRVMSTLSESAEANAEVLVALADRVTRGIETILLKVESGDGTLARLVNDPGLYESMLASADTLRTIATDMRAVTSVAENAATWGALGAFRFAELMEAAKHNWLFRRYFEERGTMEQAPFEIRERALAQTYRQIELERRELLLWEERLKEREAALRGTGRAAPSAESSAPTDSTRAPEGQRP
jgi:phospholipid/cholesterol/gamma-HCH transport system substrate-binding protein